MRIGLFLGHPAHFHMLKEAAKNLSKNGHSIHFVIKKKDVLEDLLTNEGLPYTIIREGRTDSFFGLAKSVIGMEINMCKFLRRNKIDILVGSTLSFAARCIMRVPTIVMGEDDADVVPRFAKMVYPWASAILTPEVCDNGKWDKKSIKYQSYQELAYLHPNQFRPDIDTVRKYIQGDKPYFILRFAKLNAHHDTGIKGINKGIALHIISQLKAFGEVFITSERTLETELEPYRISINPSDMHHVIAFASLYIGDSQTMAAEAGVLGTPFIRFNDFVGRIGYLRELEDAYHLGFGFTSDKYDKMYEAIDDLLNMTDRKDVFQRRRNTMLAEKIDYAKFLTWFIENYPSSMKTMKETPDYQYNFK